MMCLSFLNYWKLFLLRFYERATKHQQVLGYFVIILFSAGHLAKIDSCLPFIHNRDVYGARLFLNNKCNGFQLNVTACAAVSQID